MGDRAGKVSVYKYRLVATDTAGDATDVFAAAASVVANIVAVTACKIKGYQVEKVFLEGAYTDPTAAQALNSVLAQVTCQIHAQPNESGVIYIPGPLDLVFLAQSGADADKVNFAQGEVDDWLDMFNINGTGLVYTSDGETLDTNIHKGVRVSRKRTSP